MVKKFLLNCGSIYKRLFLFFHMDFSDSYKNIGKFEVLLFCHDVDRPLSLNGKAYSPLMDSLREDLEARGLSCLSVAHPWCSLTRDKAYGRPISFNVAYVKFRLLAKIGALLGIGEGFVKSPYKIILEKTEARLLITIGAPKDLAVAAHTAKVFHVELLHGIGYREIPWGWNELEAKYLPGGILSLDKVSTNTFKELTQKGIEIHTVPHLFLKRFTLSRRDHNPGEWNLNMCRRDKYFKNILVSLTHGYAGDHGPNTHFKDIVNNGLFFDEISELVKDERDVFWWFRFHPIQLRDPRYKNLLQFMDCFVAANPNSDWKEASRLPFPSVAMHCDGNISMCSMACYDAAAMGVPSLLLCPSVQNGGIYQNWFADLEDEGYVQKSGAEKAMLRSWVFQTRKLEPRLSNLGDDGCWEEAVKWMLHKSCLQRVVNG